MGESQKQAKLFLLLILQAEQDHLNTLTELIKKSRINQVKYKDKIKELKTSMMPKQAFFNKEAEKGTNYPIPQDLLSTLVTGLK